MLTLRLLNSPCRVHLSQNLPQVLVRLCHNNAAHNTQKPQSQIKVYEGELRAKLRWLKFMSIGTCTVALCVQPKVATKIFDNTSGVLSWCLMAGVFVFAISSTPLLHLFSKGYVTELRFEPHTKIFEADTYSMFARTKTMVFTQDDVTFPDLLGPLSTLKIKNKSYLIDFEKICNHEAFECIMKYDKPLDLMMGDDDTEEDRKAANR